MIKKNQQIENKYKALSELDHIIKRSGMYLGSVQEEECQKFIYNPDIAKIESLTLNYTPALLKIVDEAISNSCDEYRREDNMGLDTISVTLNQNGEISIEDNGGIPVEYHKDFECYLPEAIFSKLRTSSNYNDSEERDVIGTNGLGIKLCNVSSTFFSVYTADGKNSFYQSWKNNMKEKNDDQKIIKCKEHFTKLVFTPDFNLFNDIDEINNDFALIIEKRCIDAAAANIGLTVNFKYILNDNSVKRDYSWHFDNFEEYADLYSDCLSDMDNCIKYSDKLKQIWIYPDGGINIGFVNGAECSKGTHIRAIRNEINKRISDTMQSKHKIDIGNNKNADNMYTVFCNFHVNNPAFDSQTKETLTTPIEKFTPDNNYKFSVTESFLKEIDKSEIIELMKSWYMQKQEVEDQKTIRKLNKDAQKKMRSSDKFIDCTSKKREDRELFIFEGNSASSSFRSYRFPDRQCGYLLRGKVLNVSGLSPSKIMENKELSDLVNIIGLQWGQKNNVKDLKISKILINTDADEDGSCICGLLLNFFNLWPELFEAQMVCRIISPIIVAKKGNDIRKYYTLPEYHKDEKKLNGYNIKYLKGLGSQTDDLAKEMYQHPILHYFTYDEMAAFNLKSWFGKNQAQERKKMLKNDVE